MTAKNLEFTGERMVPRKADIYTFWEHLYRYKFANQFASGKQVLDIAIANSAPTVRWSQVAAEMQKHAESAGFSVVKDFVGHGIGRQMHEEPRVPNFVNNDLLVNDIVLAEGMVLAVEPMINAGSDVVRTLKNGWTVVTKDRKCSAHFEHTIAIVENGCEVLTRKE